MIVLAKPSAESPSVDGCFRVIISLSPACVWAARPSHRACLKPSSVAVCISYCSPSRIGSADVA